METAIHLSIKIELNWKFEDLRHGRLIIIPCGRLRGCSEWSLLSFWNRSWPVSWMAPTLSNLNLLKFRRLTEGTKSTCTATRPHQIMLKCVFTIFSKHLVTGLKHRRLNYRHGNLWLIKSHIANKGKILNLNFLILRLRHMLVKGKRSYKDNQILYIKVV